jgi:serine/threonine protein kinase
MSAGNNPYRTDNPSALPPGTRLGEFELLSLLGVGGFGIVYLAFDHALEREVAVKEYMPASLAGRTETMHVSLRSHSDAETFALGLKSFVNEAKLLARFDHPSLLKVHRFWEANGTAYMAMPVLRGRTLKDIRAEMGGPPDEAWLRRILVPLLGAIEKLHSEGVYHRDIAPDNIQIEPDGRPVLLDFGAARRVLSDKSQALTAILKPAYAPIEQYGEAGAVRQGPWTDLYALGATLHYLLLGRPPSPATARTVHDEASSLTVDQLPGCTENFLLAIDWMLCPRPTDRPQSVAELRQVLEGRASLPARRATEAAPVHAERTSLQRPGDGRIDLDVGDDATQIVSKPAAPALPKPTAAASDTTTVMRPLAAAPESTEHLDIVADSGSPGATAASPPPKSKLPVVLAGLAALAVGAVLWWMNQTPVAPAPAPAPAQAPAPTAQPAPPAASVAAQPLAASQADAAAVPAASAAASQPAAESAVRTVVVPPAERPAKAQQVDKPTDKAADKNSVKAADRAADKPADKAVERASGTRTNPPVATKPAAVPEPVPAGPGPSCGSRDGVRYLVCMERECGMAEFASHPACQRWKP